MQNRVSQALPRLPEEVRQIGVSTVKSSPNLTMVVHIVSPDERYDELYLRNYAVLQIKDRLSRIPGVGQVQVFGGGDYAMRIWLDPQQIAARGLTAGDVVGAIREQNVQVAAGVVGGSPMPDKIAYQLSVNARGRLTNEEEFGQIVLKTGKDGELTRLKDVARIELAAGSYSLRSSLNNKPAVGIGIFQAPGSNALQLSTDVRATMAEIKTIMPEGVDYSVVYDPTKFVRESINEVIKTLFEATLLVVIVVVLFLQTWRASIIPLVAVPISIVGTFAVLLMFGFSINTLSLFGLVLAIGIVVDDAIVVVENVERNIEDGLSPLDAAHKAMDEVSGPIIAIALVLCAVFVPIAFISGLTGQFYRQFALTIAFSTLISAFNSLTLSPALAAILLKPHGAPPDRLTVIIDRLFGWIFRPFNRVFKRGSEKYRNGVKGAIARAPLALGVYAVLLVVTVFMFRIVPDGLRADAGQAVPHRLRAAARCGDARPHRRGDPRDVTHRHGAGGRGGRGRVHRPLHQRLRECVERRHRVLPAQAVRGAEAEGPLRLRAGRRPQCQVQRHPGRLRRGLPPAAGGRHRLAGRVQGGDRGPGRSR